MRQKIILSLLTFSILSGPINLVANNDNVFNIAIKQANYKKIDNYVNRLNSLAKYTKEYILSTGDINPNINKIANYFHTNINKFYNYSGESITIKVYTDFIKFENIFDKNIDNNIIQYFRNSPNLDNLFIISENEPSNIYNMFNKKELNFIDNIIKIKNSNDIIISSNPPYDIKNIWYKPDGNGGMNIYTYNFNKRIWEKQGTISITDDENGKVKEIVVNSKNILDKLTASDGTKAIVNDGNIGSIYVYDSNLNKWLLLSENGVNGKTIYEIISNIDPILNRNNYKLYDSSVNSHVTVSNILNNSSIEFIKMNRYWKSNNKYNIPNFCNNNGTILASIYIVDKDSNLPNNSIIVPKCSVAYSMENNINGFKGNNSFPELVFDGTKWNYIIPNLDQLTRFGKINKKYKVYNINKYFIHKSVPNSIVGYWVDTDFTTVVSSGSRKDMLAYNNINNYYSLKLCQNDELCSKYNSNEPRYTSNGLKSNIYGSNTIGKFYKWVKDNSIKSVNGLSDIVECPNNLTFDSIKELCITTPTCNINYYFDKIQDKCIPMYTSMKETAPICPDPSTYNLNNKLCEYKPQL